MTSFGRGSAWLESEDECDRWDIVGNRQSGKTTALIRIANKYGGTILCADYNRVQHTRQLARILGLFIQEPTIYDSILRRDGGAKPSDGPFHIDDAHEFIRRSAVLHCGTAFQMGQISINAENLIILDRKDRK